MKASIIFFVLLLSLSASAQDDCSLGLQYYHNIEVSFEAGSGSQLPNTYAIPFYGKGLFDAGKIQADGGDLRITDGDCNPLSFYTQGVAERDTNVVYVALPAMEETGMTIRLHYGSEETQTSTMSGEDVFIFFDDFEDGVVDDDAWETVGSFILHEESNGNLVYAGNYDPNGGIFQYVCLRESYTDPVTFDYTSNVSNQKFYGIANGEGLTRVGFRYDGGLGVDSLRALAYFTDTVNGGQGIATYPNLIVVGNDLNVISTSAYITEDSYLALTRFQNLSNHEANLDTVIVDWSEFSGLRPFFSSLSTIQVEYLGVRNTPAVLPTTNATAEVTNPNTGVGLITYIGDLLTVSPNPCSSILRIAMKPNTNSTQEATICLYDMQGRVLIQESWTPELDVSNLASGTYSLHVLTVEGVYTTQLIHVN